MGVDLIRVESAREMRDAILDVFPSADYVIKSAAVSDFTPAETLPEKKKKSGKSETLTLNPTDDILALLANKRENQILVGFCAETENLEKNAQEKLARKKLDLIIANRVGGEHSPFQSDQNEVLVLDRLGNKNNFDRQEKRVLACRIWEIIIERTAQLKSHPIVSHA